jgi:HlyD family secretion protein
LRVGNPAAVMVPGLAEPVSARVTLISPALDPGSTTVEVWVRIDNQHGELKVGTGVKVALTGRSAREALKVPAAAIQTAPDGRKFVTVIADGGTARRKPVTVGIVNDDEVEVTGGITASDLVITTGAVGLDEGTKVTVASGGDEDRPEGKASGGDH